MQLSFLNPLLWIGALAIAAPIWLHLRRKQETNLLEFSALRFLDDQPEPRQSPIRLQDLLLFALRALALLLFVGAFAWPYLRGKGMTPVKESRVYILDNTFSHQANDGFRHDRDRVLSDLDSAGTDVQIAVIELTSVPRVTVAFGDSRDAAKHTVSGMKPSFQRGSYLAAFRQANSLLANSLGAHGRIILLGDNQENQWNENVNSPAFLRDAQLDLPKSTAAQLPNLSLSDPRVQRIFLGDKSLINFTAKFRHTGEAKTANIILRANDQVIFNRSVDLEKQSETILLQAQWETDPTIWLRGEVTAEGTPDALPADNHTYFSLAPVKEGKVAVLAQSHFLRVALSPEIMRGQWAMRVLDPAKLDEELAANQDAEVLCIESSYLQSAEARKLLWHYLTSGRGVFLMVNRVTPAIAGFLRELGFESHGNAESASGEKFQYVISNHPIFHPFLSPDYGNLLDIRVTKYNQLGGVQAMPLIFAERGGALFFQGTKLQGKLFVSAFGLDRDSTTWPVHQSFIPFLDLTLQAARAEDPTPTTFEPGELGTVQMPVESKTREVVLRAIDISAPASTSPQPELGRIAVENNQAQVRLPDQPGLYALTYDEDPQIQKVFSVNPSPKESELSYAMDTPEAIKIWQVSDAAKIAKNAATANRAKISMSAILQQRYWWWMVLAGLLALVVESAVAGAKAR